MDIYTLIHHDHETVKKLIEQINTLPESGAPDRFTLFGQFKDAAIVHNVAEAGSFYAELERYGDASAKMMHSRQEHAEVRFMLEKLSDSAMAEAQWKPLFAEFQEALLQHIEEEESEVFAMARKLLSRQQTIQLVNIMEDLKSKKCMLDKAS